ncbi:MAG: hypothetical protein KGJ60_13890 [Verrucomicrobiota bacterium]|nr:hypothetical protein [Verrucomicrobiota bacterium]
MAADTIQQQNAAVAAAIGLTPFFASFTEVLPKTGAVIRVDATGNFFFCKEASARFRMRFDIGQWFEFDQSFFFRLADGEKFTRVEFQAIETAADTTVLFYVCSREVGAHLNIIRNPDNFQSFQYAEAATLLQGLSVNTVPANDNYLFPGTAEFALAIDPGKASYNYTAYSYRKSIIVCNDDPSSVLELYRLLPTANTWTIHTGAPLGADLAQCERISTIQPLKAFLIESSDSVVVANETASPISLRVCGIFYPAGS